MKVHALALAVSPLFRVGGVHGLTSGVRFAQDLVAGEETIDEEDGAADGLGKDPPLMQINSRHVPFRQNLFEPRSE